MVNYIRSACLIAAVIALPLSAAADALDDFNRCAQLGDDDAIAACLHGNAPAANPPPAGQTGAKPFDPNQKPPEKPAEKPKKERNPEPPIDGNDIGSWTMRIDKSKVDDSESVYLSVDSSETLYDDLRGPIRPTLTVRCRENETDVIINWESFWFYDETLVTARVDDKKATKATWSDSTNHVAIFHPNAIPFIRSLMGAEKLLIRATPISESPQEVTFNIHGLRNIIPRLKKACHWN